VVYQKIIPQRKGKINTYFKIISRENIIYFIDF